MNSNAYMADYMKRRYHRRREAGLMQLGGRCVKCGCTDQQKLQFHHRAPPDKAFTIGKVLAGAAEECVQAELLKCDVVCDDCHKDIHRPDRLARGLALRRHGIGAYTTRGCRCEICKTAKRLSRRVRGRMD